jgi:hypothetical protein
MDTNNSIEETNNSTFFVINIDELNLNDLNQLKKIILHIETNILGKIPEIKRLIDHYKLIFDLISSSGNQLNSASYKSVEVEINQLKNIFNVNDQKFKLMIENKDVLQYSAFIKKIKHIENVIRSLESCITNIIEDLRFDFKKSLGKELDKKNIKFKINRYKTIAGKINSRINGIVAFIDKQLIDKNSSIKNIDWIFLPSNNKSSNSKKKQRSSITTANVFGITQAEYKDLIEDEKLIDIHKPTRKFKCQITQKSAQMFIDKCFENAFFKVIDSDIKIFSECLGTKNCNAKCGIHINLCDLIKKLNLQHIYEKQLIEQKRSLIKKYCNIDVLRRCPKPNCPNGDGFFPKDVIDDLLIGKITSDMMTIHSCNLCNSIWCSKCFKSHPGRLCAELESDDLGKDIKKCPNCLLPCERDGGCFHIACNRCRMHWCWECNYFTPQSNAYAHKCLKGEWVEVNNDVQISDV